MTLKASPLINRGYERSEHPCLCSAVLPVLYRINSYIITNGNAIHGFIFLENFFFHCKKKVFRFLYF